MFKSPIEKLQEKWNIEEQSSNKEFVRNKEKTIEAIQKIIDEKGTGCFLGIPQLIAQLIFNYSKDLEEYDKFAIMNETFAFFTAINCDKLKPYIDLLFNNYKIGTQEEADCTIKLILQNKDKQVLTLTPDTSKIIYLFVDDINKNILYIRRIWNNSKKYTKSDYVTSPNLNFWKQRNFEINNLKGNNIYGDCRDPGYILNYSYGDKFNINGMPERSITKTFEIEEIFFYLNCIEYRIKDKLNDAE